MNSNVRIWRLCLGLAVGLAAGCAVGCQGPVSRLELASYADPYFPEHSTVEFQNCAYRIDAGGDIHIVGRHDTQAESGRVTMRQNLHVDIYWKPYPGRTPVDPTMTDALVRYVVATPEGVATYAGTGFVFPKTTPGRTIEVDLESARLRLETTTGSLGDVLGETHVTGKLAAKHDPGTAAKLSHDLELVAAE